MLQPFRDEFNARFREEDYGRLMQGIAARTGVTPEFRVCETPCFFSRKLIADLAAIGAELTGQLVGNYEYMKASDTAVPERYRVPDEDAHPHFMTVDFGLVREEDGTYAPKLVELQAFPSIFGFQELLAQQYASTYKLDARLGWLLGEHDSASYWELLRRVIVAGHDPEEVILTDVRPELQKTLPDFQTYREKLGIAIVDIAKLERRGSRLFYHRDGKVLPVRRIFNRAIVDEIVREGVELPFDYRDELDVEWAGHPNWYFRLSKFSLPYLNHACVPKTMFLDEWLSRVPGGGMEDRSRLLLKPLYSFAGKGIEFAPSDTLLETIPREDRHLYLMQEKMNFAPVIHTPEGPTQAEIRVMYVWPDDGVLDPVICLVRLGRGLMMGVDHNRDKRWVGGSAAFML